MTRRIFIDPVAHLEGHARVEILLDGQGNAANSYSQILELRGFERF
ncbi:MAG: hypothetical protein AMXMBFR60_28630 [Chloroflexota bacterium]|nr:hypothetical protein [Anaerolineales bacterium]NUQ58368.1 hypothetical protein [Anaerolineales bacterium]